MKRTSVSNTWLTTSTNYETGLNGRCATITAGSESPCNTTRSWMPKRDEV